MEKRIFIIEDDVANLSVFTASLRNSGIRVECNVLGFDIVSHVAECLPLSLILLDIKLRSDLNGYDVYREIRKHPKLKQIPVVAVTSLNPETEIPKARTLGFSGFIGKPIDMRNFPGLIAKVLDGENIWITGF